VGKLDLEGGRFLVEIRGGGRQAVRISETTRIVRNRKPAKLSDLQSGDRIVVKHAPAESGPVTATTILARGE
jgi:hypothetical protein